MHLFNWRNYETAEFFIKFFQSAAYIIHEQLVRFDQKDVGRVKKFSLRKKLHNTDFKTYNWINSDCLRSFNMVWEKVSQSYFINLHNFTFQ